MPTTQYIYILALTKPDDLPAFLKKRQAGVAVLLPSMLDKTYGPLDFTCFQKSHIVYVAAAAWRRALVHGILNINKVL